MLATIGYERSSLADFVVTLALAKVEVLIDIRERAQSRRSGFSKIALRTALESASIEYMHLPELGDPKEGREAARSGNLDLFQKVFHTVMQTSKAGHALTAIEQLVATRQVCLMCFERDQNQCHRKIVSDFLEARLGIKAHHLGVRLGVADDSSRRRVLHSHQGAATSV